MSKDLKCFTQFDKDIKLVSLPSDLDEYDNDPGVLRAMLSCNHVTGPDTLTDCCSTQLEDGKSEFRCPECDEEWTYDEVRKLAKLTTKEQLTFEEKLWTNTAKKKDDVRDCPGCGTFIVRSNVSNICVECLVCTASNRKTYEFCWECMRVWKGPRDRADRCGNVGCAIADRELLRDCPMITLPNSNAQCPKVRACTSCGLLIEHNGGCKNMKCPECNNQFCFVCLTYGNCSGLCNLAPRQINSNDM